jgi:hypothetical protein
MKYVFHAVLISVFALSNLVVADNLSGFRGSLIKDFSVEVTGEKETASVKMSISLDEIEAQDAYCMFYIDNTQTKPLKLTLSKCETLKSVGLTGWTTNTIGTEIETQEGEKFVDGIEFKSLLVSPETQLVLTLIVESKTGRVSAAERTITVR